MDTDTGAGEGSFAQGGNGVGKGRSIRGKGDIHKTLAIKKIKKKLNITYIYKKPLRGGQERPSYG